MVQMDYGAVLPPSQMVFFGEKLLCPLNCGLNEALSYLETLQQDSIVDLKQVTTTMPITTTNMTKTKTMTKTNTCRELLQRVIPETCDLWDIWSEWWGDNTWPKKDNDKDKDNEKTNTFREHLHRAILETCDLGPRLGDIWSEWWGDITWPNKTTMTKTKTKTMKK